MQELINKATQLLADGTVDRVLGWRRAELPGLAEPAFFYRADDLRELIYDETCSANLSKYLIPEREQQGRTLIFLKPCDSYSLMQLIKEHRVRAEAVYAVALGCGGNTGADRQLLERCLNCKGETPVFYQEQLLMEQKPPVAFADRFAGVAEVETLPAEKRFQFWQKELSRCIRCNACRNACPACSCRTCVFDGQQFDSRQLANHDSFEEKMFHLIRAFHVAGRCTDCGECSRVCPQGIPLHLLNRRMIKDMNQLYGEYQAGADMDGKNPLTDFTFADAEPDVIWERGASYVQD